MNKLVFFLSIRNRMLTNQFQIKLRNLWFSFRNT